MLISALELIKRSFDLYKKNLEVFFSYSLLIFAPNAMLFVLAIIISSVFDLNTDPFVDTMYGLIFILMTIIGLFISMWLTIAFLRVISERLENKNYGNFKEELLFAKGKLLSVITTTILATLAVLGGTLLFVVPGIIFSVWFFFYMFAAVLDNEKDSGALKFSKNLVVGRMWSVILLLLIPTLLCFIAISIAQFPLKQVIDASNSLAINIIMYLIGTMISALFMPFLMVSQTILYTELKKTIQPVQS
jgi:hypothetical protein